MATITPQNTDTEGVLSLDKISKFQSSFEANPANLQAMNAVATTPLSKVALNHRRASKVDNTFSHHLTENKVTAQKRSGRCWIFAALNTFRPHAIANLNVAEDFELSQNYTAFWDKLEKANYFLESILQTLDEPVGSRLFDWLMRAPVQDGGQWHMFINLIQKYGVVPKSVMPETQSSSETMIMNSQVTRRLREQACELRSMHAEGSDIEKLRARKEEMVSEIYKMLCIHLGEPVQEFNWQWRDKDKNFHRVGKITPQEFYEKYVNIDLDEYVCLIHDPRPGHDFNRLYTVKFLGNVVGGQPVEYVNVDLGTMKHAAIEQIKDDLPVWFGCDVGKHLSRDLGVMDLELFNYDLVYGPSQGMTKAERLQYGHSLMTHAMVFTGVDLDDAGVPQRWRVENSWGDAAGELGWFQMTDPWFDEYNYEVVVNKRYVPAESLEALKQEPVELEPWDPMGSLASANF